MKKERRYCQLMPEKIYQNFSDIEVVIKPKIKGYSRDHLKEVISIVACHVRKTGEPSQLQITYFKNLVAQGDKYLKALIELNIIQRSGNSIVGKTSYKYDFSDEYRSRYVSLPLNNAKLTRRIELAQKETYKKDTKSARGHSVQVKYLKLLTFAPEYNDFIELNYTAETNRYNSIISSVTRILNRDFFYSVDSTSGRFHSNVTNMAKGLRPFLRINNEPLVNLDIKNSQPFLSTILLTNPSKVSYLANNAAFVLLLQSLKVPNSEDVKNYIAMVVTGQIYEYLMTEFLKEGLELTRDETKVQMLRVLFARNRSPKDATNKQARQIFRNRFPTVHKIFTKIRGSEKGDSFQNFKRFAVLLQRIESHLMLSVILKRIHKELPGTITLTIHDSILTGIAPDAIEAVRKIMVEELEKFVGFAPNIKIEGIIGKKRE